MGTDATARPAGPVYATGDLGGSGDSVSARGPTLQARSGATARCARFRSTSRWCRRPGQPSCAQQPGPRHSGNSFGGRAVCPGRPGRGE